MRAKAFFLRVLQAEHNLDLLRKQREHWEDMSAKLGGVSDVKIQVTEMRSPTEDAAVHLADLLQEIDEQEKKYLEIVKEARWVIEQIPQERFREVLTLRYICRHSWKTIWDEMDYRSEKSALHVHGYALKAAEKILQKMSTN